MSVLFYSVGEVIHTKVGRVNEGGLVAVCGSSDTDS